MKFLILLLILIFENCILSFEFLTWTIINQNGKIKIKNISSPIDVYSALYQNSLIDWPIKGFNDVKYRWISYDNWTFISEPFSIDQSKSISLYVSGLDINPLIFLNNRLIGTTFSQFVSKDIPINSAILKASNNVLRLQFYSPLLIANVTAGKSTYSVPPDCWPDEYRGECHINFIRKTQASFGWDWGPAIPTVGIRGKIQLYQTNRLLAKIRSVKLLTNTNSDCTLWSAKVELNVFTLTTELRSKLCASAEFPNLYLSLKQCIEIEKSDIVKFTFDLPLDFKILKLWWPYELGNPTLYLLNSVVFSSDQILDSTSQYVGFRHVSLNQTQLSNNSGRMYEFYINCKSLFIKGTNWVPRTYMTDSWNNISYIEFLLNSVRTAHMNSIRLWGGGKPEHEHFYSMADRLGLMVWHDLMFACSLYPDNEAFNNVVHNEVLEIVSNLQRHPCILLWSGNNEIEVLIAQGWYNTTRMDAKNIQRYYNLFGKVIKKTVTLEDPFIPFILSSPSNGIESEKTNGVANDPQSLHYGDVHFYVYDGDLWNETLYPITRMTTEFGFQSLPIMETWRRIIFSENDFNISGSLINHVQHHPGGNIQLKNAIIYYFGKLFPHSAIDVIEQYKWFSYLSQINQANILKVHINKLRSSQCLLTPDGIGLTRGAMYWQLNDNWVAPTWSSIDYFGRWKLAHYYVKDSFSPMRINIAIVDKAVTVTLILKDDLPKTMYDIIIICKDITQKVTSEPIGQKSMKFHTYQSGCNVNVVMVMDINDFLKVMYCPDMRKCLFLVNLVSNGSVVSSDFLMVTNPLHLTILNEVARDKISVKISESDHDHSTCAVVLRNSYVHLYVTLTTTTLGVFSNNGLHLINNETTIVFNPWIPDAKEFFNCSLLRLEIYSINGLYA